LSFEIVIAMISGLVGVAESIGNSYGSQDIIYLW